MASQPNIALETICSLADGQTLESHAAGDLIFHAGEPGDHLFAIIDGSVRIEWGEDIFEVLEPGDCFGFDVMVDPRHLRYCSAFAASSVQLLPMNRERFLLAIQEFPMFALESLQALDDRLRRVKASASDELAHDS